MADPADLYELDLTQFSLARLRQMLEAGDVLPSRRILTEQVAERFAVLGARGITNLQQLVDALSTKKKVERFAQETGLPLEYLEILGRQARSYIPTPVNFKDIPGLTPDVVERLAAASIKHTKHLFARVQTPQARAALSAETGIPAGTLLELAQLSDLARAGWVGPVFVRILHKAGVHTLEALANSDPVALFERLRAVNEALQLTKASFTLKDVAACIETAKELPKVIEYQDRA